MKKINLFGIQSNTKNKRFVGDKFRTIENKINSTYRDYRLYDEHRNNGYGGYIYDGRWKPIAKKICKRYKLNNNSNFLQLACEKGFLLNDIKEIYPKMSLTGFDLSKYAIKNSLRTVRKFIKKGSYNKLKLYKDNHFDFVLAVGVVYSLNLTDALKCIKEIDRVSIKCFINLASYKTEKDYWLFKKWTLLGTTILLENEWIKVLRHCNYSGDYYFTNAQNLNLIKEN